MPSRNNFVKLRKMRGGAMIDTSSPGIDFTQLLLLILVAIFGFIAFHIYKTMNTPINVGANTGAGQPAATIQEQKPVNVIVQGGGGDSRYSMAPDPLRFWRAPPDPGVWNPTTLPSISSRGLPESFQTIGLLKYPGGDLKPLYGRRTAGSNDRWNYYTRTDTYNPVPVPLKQGRRDCMEDTGCTEVFDGDRLKSLNGEEVAVNLYKMRGPTYIPAI
jgi:hypothetical protein